MTPGDRKWGLMHGFESTRQTLGITNKRHFWNVVYDPWFWNRKPDAAFWNQVSEAIFQNHVPDGILVFCNYASDEKYESGYTLKNKSKVYKIEITLCG